MCSPDRRQMLPTCSTPRASGSTAPCSAPTLNWRSRPRGCRRLLGAQSPRRPRHLACGANGSNTQPAVACCRRKEDGVYRANSIHLLTVTDKAVERLTVFVEPRLFESFGLPEVYED